MPWEESQRRRKCDSIVICREMVPLFAGQKRPLICEPGGGTGWVVGLERWLKQFAKSVGIYENIN